MNFPGSNYSELDSKLAHPKAQGIFVEPFFWDEIDDASPWGSDLGADALAAFCAAHGKDALPPDPVSFALSYAGEYWQATRLANKADDQEIENYSVGNRAVISITLGMYLLHGYLPVDAHQLCKEAIERELQPICYNQFGFPEDRVEKLKICLKKLLLTQC